MVPTPPTPPGPPLAPTPATPPGSPATVPTTLSPPAAANLLLLAQADLAAERVKTNQLKVELVAAIAQIGGPQTNKLNSEGQEMLRLDRKYQNTGFDITTPKDAIANKISNPTLIVADKLEMVMGMTIPPGVKVYAMVPDRTQPVDPSAPPLLECIIAELGGNIDRVRGRDVLSHKGVAQIYELVRQDGTDKTTPKMITTVNPKHYSNLRLGGRGA